MVRTVPPDRLRAVLDAAALVFIAHGYRRTQMQDVADALGLAKGTLYGYAQGKEALFAGAVRFADDAEPLPGPSELPLPAPAAGELAGLVASRLAAEVPDMALTRALTKPARSIGHPAAPDELAAIVVDLYRRLARNRTAIKLVDRCAPELPELAEVWLNTGRGAQMSGMEAYLSRRQASGDLVLPGPAPLVARTVVELCVLWAVHCRFDPAPQTSIGSPINATDDTATDDDVVAATLATLLVRGMTSAPHQSTH